MVINHNKKINKIYKTITHKCKWVNNNSQILDKPVVIMEIKDKSKVKVFNQVSKEEEHL